MPLRPHPSLPYKPVPEGTFTARLYQVIYEGTVEDTYQGKPKNTPLVRMTWEIFSKEKRDDGKNFSISQKYTFSYNEKANLRKAIQGMLGRSLLVGEVASKNVEELFDLETLVGKECMITIMHKTSESTGNVRANVATVAAPPEGLTVPESTYETLYFNVEEFDPAFMETFNLLPDFVQDEIKTSPEYKKAMGYETPKPKLNDEGEINIDDIPF